MNVRALIRTTLFMALAAILVAPLGFQQGYSEGTCPAGQEKVINTGECAEGPYGHIVRNKVGRLMNINRCATYKSRANDELSYHQQRLNSGAFDPSFTTQVADYNVGDIAVLIDDRANIISQDALGTRIDLVAATRQFYETHQDTYDFLFFFPNFNHAEGSFHIHVKNDVQGIGVPLMDDSALYNPLSTETNPVPMVNLKSLVLLRNFQPWPADGNTRIPGNNDSALSLLAQETGHRWAAWVKADKNLGTKKRPRPDAFLLGRNEAHWCFYMNVPATGPSGGFSSMEGNFWFDNGDGTYTTVAQSDGYHQLDQYLAGFRSGNAVDPFFRLDPGNGNIDPDCAHRPFTPGEDSPWTFAYPKIDVTVNDIQRVEGARDPDSDTSQKNYRVAFVLLAPQGATVPSSEITKLDNYRIAWENYFRDESGGGQMFTALGALDVDQDGYNSIDDCDDEDPTINPGAAEICNNVDDDCDFQIDEDFDLDGDLYTTCGGDCNDNDASINPIATEVWNGIDDNCDNVIDNVQLVDADGDGYYVNPENAFQEDCDDGNAAINPGAAEIVNLIDDNCNLLVDCSDPAVVPETELGPRASDGLDNDCNGVIDG